MFDEDTELDDFFAGAGGAPSMRFEHKGDSITGVISQEVKIANVIDMDTQLPKKYPDGNPVKQAIITLQTTWRNFEGVNPEKVAEGMTDDGLRTLWCAGNMGYELKKALREGGCKGAPPVGSMLQFTWHDSKPPARVGWKGQKLFTVRWKGATAESLAQIAASLTGASDDSWAPAVAVAQEPKGVSTLESMRAQRNNTADIPF